MKEESGFYCIDWDDDNPFKIFGTEGDPDYARLDFKLGPCNEIAITPDVHPECHYDPEDQFEYLTNAIDLIVLTNNERFGSNQYGESKIIKESTIIEWQLNPRSPSWVPYYVEMQELEDESAFLQYGQ